MNFYTLSMAAAHIEANHPHPATTMCYDHTEGVKTRLLTLGKPTKNNEYNILKIKSQK